MEVLPALEEEEGDVEGGSGRGEGLPKKWGNLRPLLGQQIRGLNLSRRDLAVESPSEIFLVSPAPDSQRGSELAQTNFQPVHFTHGKTGALRREMTPTRSCPPQIQARDPDARPPSCVPVSRQSPDSLLPAEQ